MAAAKKKAVAQAIAIGKGKAPKDLADAEPDLVLEVEAAFAEAGLDDDETTAFMRALSGLDAVEDLETVDLDGVEILATGGPYFGKGSPKEGDYFDQEFLTQLAEDTMALMGQGELRSPLRVFKPANKIGHGKEQALLQSLQLAEDEMPAGGWLENLQVTEGGKLLADIRKIPKKVAQIIKAQGLRTRSVEMANVTSQTDGKKRLVVQAVSWLGAKAPAVRTLDDVIAWYSGEGIDPEKIVVQFADSVSWKPDESFEAIRSQVSAALGSVLPSPGGMTSWYVRDISGDVALVCIYGNGTDENWAIPFTRKDGEVEVGARDQWAEAMQTWVTKSAEYADRNVERRVRDTAAQMPVKLSDLTEAQLKTFAETLSIEGTDDVEKLREAVGEALGLKADEAPPTPAPAPAPAATATAEGAPQTALSEDLERRLAAAEASAAAAQALVEASRVEKRDKAIQEAVSAGRLNPADIDKWRGFYDANEEQTVLMLAQLPVNDDLVREFGAEGEGSGDAEELFDRQYAAWAKATGIERDAEMLTVHVAEKK